MSPNLSQNCESFDRAWGLGMLLFKISHFQSLEMSWRFILSISREIDQLNMAESSTWPVPNSAVIEPQSPDSCLSRVKQPFHER